MKYKLRLCSMVGGIEQYRIEYTDGIFDRWHTVVVTESQFGNNYTAYFDTEQEAINAAADQYIERMEAEKKAQLRAKYNKQEAKVMPDSVIAKALLNK